MKIHVKNSSYGPNKLTIHFNKDESIENVCMLLKELIPEMDYQIVGKEIYIEWSKFTQFCLVCIGRLSSEGLPIFFKKKVSMAWG